MTTQKLDKIQESSIICDYGPDHDANITKRSSKNFPTRNNKLSIQLASFSSNQKSSEC